MYLLDTVTISETQKATMDPAVSAFYARIRSDMLFLSVASISEFHYGLNLMPHGKRRDSIRSWLVGIEDSFANQVLGVDEELGRKWGQLRADIRKVGYTIEFNDLLIAATAIHHDLTVVTRNIRDFAPTGCKILNPWDDGK